MEQQFADGFDLGAAAHDRHSDCPEFASITDAFVAFMQAQNVKMLEHLRTCSKTTPEELTLFENIARELK